MRCQGFIGVEICLDISGSDFINFGRFNSQFEECFTCLVQAF